MKPGRRHRDSLPPPQNAVAARRKLPQQPRAHATVRRIQQAMLAVVQRDGYAAASTNRVAREAGVTIASLYQYFPNKQAIAISIFEDAAVELARRVNDCMLAGMHLPLEEGLSELLTMIVDVVEAQRSSLLDLPEEVPDLQHLLPSITLETLAYSTGLAYLRQQFPDLDERGLLCKLFFVQRIGMSMIRQYVLEAPQDISRELFIAELIETVAGYLRKPIARPERIRASVTALNPSGRTEPPSARRGRAARP